MYCYFILYIFYNFVYLVSVLINITYKYLSIFIYGLTYSFRTKVAKHDNRRYNPTCITTV